MLHACSELLYLRTFPDHYSGNEQSALPNITSGSSALILILYLLVVYSPIFRN